MINITKNIKNLFFDEKRAIKDFNELEREHKRFIKTVFNHKKIIENSEKKLKQCTFIDYEKINEMNDKEKIQYLIDKILDIKENYERSLEILDDNLYDLTNNYENILWEYINFSNEVSNGYNDEIMDLENKYNDEIMDLDNEYYDKILNLGCEVVNKSHRINSLEDRIKREYQRGYDDEY